MSTIQQLHRNPDSPIVDGTLPCSELAQSFGRLGSLEVRLARNNEEIMQAKILRHKVFMADKTDDCRGDNTAIDEDEFDAFCDHLVVIDHGSNESIENPTHTANGKVIATYRLLPQNRAERLGSFYSQRAFPIADLCRAKSELSFLEFGRSCVLPDYRNKRTIELLWQGSWAYVRRSGHDVMFGCASFSGETEENISQSLGFLKAHASLAKDWKISANSGQKIICAGQQYTSHLDREILRNLPALIKGYLRLGAMFSDCAVADEDFGTYDVLVVLPISRLNARYVSYYGENADRHSPLKT